MASDPITSPPARALVYGLRAALALGLGAAFRWALLVAEGLLVESTDPSFGSALSAVGVVGGLVIAGTVGLTLVILDWPSTYAGEGPQPRRWLKRLQQVNLRTKIVVPVVALAVVPTGALGLLVVPFLEATLRNRLVDELEFRANSSAYVLESFLQELHRDLRVLSRLPQLARLADTSSPNSWDPRLRSELERDLVAFAQGRRGYAELRLLDTKAREVLRLEAIPGEAALTPVSQLRTGTDPHFLDAALGMESGQIYVSQLDVIPGFEGGGEPVLSCATPIELEGGEGRGLIVVNVNPADMASMLGPMPPGTEAWLVDQRDRYIAYIGPSAEKRAQYALSRQRALSEDFDADVLGYLRGGRSPRTVEVGEAIVTAASLTVDPRFPDQQWTLLMAQPLASVAVPARQLSTALRLALAILLSVAAASGVLIAHYVSRPLALLRQATVEIAAGDLSQEVRVTTGDEIEGLAQDFNRMTRRLRKAQQQLADWNTTLQAEVDLRTEHLQQLQAGLARADKLATVGQMAASIMHEIGNPLAAIKTKIQVAEEGADLDERARSVLGGVLAEVDRLATVLRSFSRLGRLGSAKHEPVSLVETVHGVTALVGPELRRKGVSLDVEAPDGLPPIQGEADRLRQLLINLVLNASEASEAGGQVSVRLSHTADTVQDGASSTVTVDIVDQGTGIAAENLNKIWNPLFTTKPEGTGLGLAICKEIVEDHGGTIDVRSTEGEGTVVSLSFPALLDRGRDA